MNNEIEYIPLEGDFIPYLSKITAFGIGLGVVFIGYMIIRLILGI